MLNIEPKCNDKSTVVSTKGSNFQKSKPQTISKCLFDLEKFETEKIQNEKLETKSLKGFKYSLSNLFEEMKHNQEDELQFESNENIRENFSFLDVEEVSDSGSIFSFDFNLKDLKEKKLTDKNNLVLELNQNNLNLDPNDYLLNKRSFANFDLQSNNKTTFNRNENQIDNSSGNQENESKSKLKGPNNKN